MEKSNHKQFSSEQIRQILVFSVFAILPFLSHAYDQRVVVRDTPTRHYQEMKCTPLPNKKNVTAYKCPFESVPPGTQKCIYRGALLNDGQTVPDITCHIACMCTTGSENLMPDITCAQIDCGEFFNPKNDSCINQYELDKCCSTNEVCGKTEIDKLFKCVVNGHTYLEGQRFYPDTCLECVCKKGFKGQCVEPFCKPLYCGVERGNYGQIVSRCAVVYHESHPCCPIEWQCLKKSDKVVKSGRPSSYQCSYGNLKLNIGDKIQTTNRCRECSCDYPPLVTCIQKTGCIP